MIRDTPTRGKIRGKQPTLSANQGMALMSQSDCKACHLVNQKLVGHALLDISPSGVLHLQISLIITL